jgi:hypothetical protein
MLYKKFFKLKEDTKSITDLEATHRYLHSLESTLTLYAWVLQRVFVEFKNSYTLLDVHNNSEKLELVYAHFEVNTMKPPSRSTPQPPPVALTRSSHFFSMAKVVHLVAPIHGNPAHKASECNIPFEDLFCNYCRKEGH